MRLFEADLCISDLMNSYDDGNETLIDRTSSNSSSSNSSDRRQLMLMLRQLRQRALKEQESRLKLQATKNEHIKQLVIRDVALNDARGASRRDLELRLQARARISVLAQRQDLLALQEALDKQVSRPLS